MFKRGHQVISYGFSYLLVSSLAPTLASSKWLEFVVNSSNKNQTTRDDSNMNFLNSNNLDLRQLDANYLAERCGYRVETHRVLTKDRYVLKIHRLMNPEMREKKNKGLVIVQHGILCSSSFFLLNSSPQTDQPRALETDGEGKETLSNSLAIALSNLGFDVWLTNFRGTEYSNHLFKTASQSSYWNFNVDTLIKYDLGSTVNYILNHTKQPNYTFIGHSLGATVGLGALLVHQDTQIVQKLACTILMAPVVSTQYMRGSLLPLFRLATLFYQDLAPFPGSQQTFVSFVRRVCPLIPRLCVWFASMFIGTKQGGQFSARNENEYRIQVNTFLMMMRQSISIRMLKHIVQVNSSGRLSRFNYGPSENGRIYGKQLAPIYDLEKIKASNLSVAIVSGLSDAISTLGEVEWISNQIRNKVKRFKQITIDEDPFNHMDLIMSQDAGKLVNQRVIEFIESSLRNRSEVNDIETTTTRIQPE